MTTINSGNIVTIPPIEIDPNSFLPPGLIDVKYIDIEDQNVNPTDDEDGIVTVIVYDEGTTEQAESTVDSLPEFQPPDWASIISQTVHVTADGKFAVDVVLDVEDIYGVTNYNVRVSKA